MKRPTLLREFGKVFGIMGGVCALTVALFAVFRLADAEDHPFRAVIIVYTIVLGGMGAFIAYSAYKSHLKSWQRQQEWDQKLGQLQRNERRSL